MLTKADYCTEVARTIHHFKVMTRKHVCAVKPQTIPTQSLRNIRKALFMPGLDDDHCRGMVEVLKGCPALLDYYAVVCMTSAHHSQSLVSNFQHRRCRTLLHALSFFTLSHATLSICSHSKCTDGISFLLQHVLHTRQKCKASSHLQRCSDAFDSPAKWIHLQMPTASLPHLF